VFDPDDLYGGFIAEEAPEPATADDVTRLATGFLRVLGLSAVVHGRKDLHVGHDGADLLRRSLIDLLLMEPPRRLRPGAKKLLPVLTDEQRSLLEALPPVADDLELLDSVLHHTATQRTIHGDAGATTRVVMTELRRGGSAHRVACEPDGVEVELAGEFPECVVAFVQPSQSIQ